MTGGPDFDPAPGDSFGPDGVAEAPNGKPENVETRTDVAD